MSLKRLVALRDVAALLLKARAPDARTSYACAAYMPSTQQGSKVVWGAGTAAVAGLACWLYDTERPAHCLHDLSEPHGSVTELSATSLCHWLASVGANVEAVDIRNSEDVRPYWCLFACESIISRLIALHYCSMQSQAKAFSLLMVFGSLCMSLGGKGHGTAGQSLMMGSSLQPSHCMRLSHRKLYWQTQFLGPHIKNF